MAAIAVIGRAFRKCATVKSGDAPKRLAEAMLKISQLQKRLAEIEAELQKHSRRFVDYVQQCRRKFEASKSLKHECEYILAQVIENWHKEHALSPAERARVIYGGNAIGQTLQDEAFAKFASEVTDWREPLETAIKAKTQIAEQALMETEATVREQLSEFDDEAVTNDPRVKRSHYELVRWQGLQSRFEGAKGSQAWKSAVEALFKND